MTVSLIVKVDCALSLGMHTLAADSNVVQGGHVNKKIPL